MKFCDFSLTLLYVQLVRLFVCFLFLDYLFSLGLLTFLLLLLFFCLCCLFRFLVSFCLDFIFIFTFICFSEPSDLSSWRR